MLTVIETVSLETQAPFVIVQIKSYTPAVLSPVTPEFGEEGEVILAALVVDQTPDPVKGVLPFKEEFPVEVQIVLSVPARAVSIKLNTIIMVSLEVQRPFTIVQTNGDDPIGRLLTPLVAVEGAVIVAVLVVVHVPTPGAALFPANTLVDGG